MYNPNINFNQLGLTCKLVFLQFENYRLSFPEIYFFFIDVFIKLLRNMQKCYVFPEFFTEILLVYEIFRQFNLQH